MKYLFAWALSSAHIFYEIHVKISLKLMVF